MMAFAPRKTESTNTNIAQLKKEPQIIMKTQSMNPKKKTLMEVFTDDFMNNISMRVLKNKLGGDVELLNQYLYLKNMSGIQAIMPYKIEF